MTTTNPPRYLPFQDSMYDGNGDQQSMVQHTTVIISTEPPKDHFIWSLLCFFYSNPCCCLGLAALIYSIKARDRKVVGDLEGARHYGATARQLNITSTVLVALGLLIFIITMIVVFARVSR
uniref:Uncharacterized protein n=1 Tax=Astatotilapia calliptera TaxID=8154 RepID=A0AAX7U4W3_ASTCA